MLVPKLTFTYRSGLYRYFVCTESDYDIDIQCTENDCTEKICTESVCTEFVMYRKRRTPLGRPRFQNLLLIVYDHINAICAIIQRLFGPQKLW